MKSNTKVIFESWLSEQKGTKRLKFRACFMFLGKQIWKCRSTLLKEEESCPNSD